MEDFDGFVFGKGFTGLGDIPEEVVKAATAGVTPVAQITLTNEEFNCFADCASDINFYFKGIHEGRIDAGPELMKYAFHLGREFERNNNE